MLLIVGRNYQRNVLLRRIKNRRAGSLEHFTQAYQQTSSGHTIPRLELNSAQAISTTLFSEFGSSKKASEMADLSSLRRRSRTTNQSTRRADRARNEEDETGAKNRLTSACIRSCGCARRRQRRRPAPGWTPAHERETWGERRGEEEEEGAEEQCLRERGGVYEGGDEEGQREGGRDAAGDGGEGPDGGHHGVPAAVPSPPAAMLLSCVFWSGGRGDLQAGAVG